jgi:hypothetical protein
LVLVVAPTVAPTLAFFFECCVGDPGADLRDVFGRMNLVFPYQSPESRRETPQPDLVVSVTVMFHGHIVTPPRAAASFCERRNVTASGHRTRQHIMRPRTRTLQPGQFRESADGVSPAVFQAGMLPGVVMVVLGCLYCMRAGWRPGWRWRRMHPRAALRALWKDRDLVTVMRDQMTGRAHGFAFAEMRSKWRSLTV